MIMGGNEDQHTNSLQGIWLPSGDWCSIINNDYSLKCG